MLKKMAPFAILIIFALSNTVYASNYEYNPGEQKLYGVVEQIPQGGYGHWVIDGRSVLVNQKTKIENEYGQITVGSYVEIEGVTDEQGFRAYEIESKPKNYSERNEYGKNYRHSSNDERGEYGKGYAGKNEFYGVIEEIPTGGLGTWRISGREIFVDRSTRIKSERGPLKVGSRVEVEGNQLPNNGAFHAREIESE